MDEALPHEAELNPQQRIEREAAELEWSRLPFVLRDHVNEYDGRPRELPLPAQSGNDCADMTDWSRLLQRAHAGSRRTKAATLALGVLLRTM